MNPQLAALIPKTLRTFALASLGVILVISSGIYVYRQLSTNPSPIPQSIRQNLTFSPFVIPTDTKNFTTTDYKFVAAEGSVQIFSSVIRSKDGPIVTVSQYTQPKEFVEVPEYKERFLTNVAKQYDTVQTSNGTIYLGRETLQNNKQLAVMLERGLIVFMSPDKELDNAQWRNIGDQLEIQKVIN